MIIVNEKKFENIKLIIFDKDGTLLDIHKYWSIMVEYRANFICKYLGLKENDKHKIGLIESMGIDWKNMRIKSCGPIGQKKRKVVLETALEYTKKIKNVNNNNHETLCEKAFLEADNLSTYNFKNLIQPIIGIKTLFQNLTKSNIKIAIATNDIKKRTELILDYMGVLKEVDMIVGSDITTKSKPHPEMVNSILEKLGISKDNTLMVGDALQDIKMGINAKIKASIGVTSGICNYNELISFTDYVIPNISHIEVST